LTEPTSTTPVEVLLLDIEGTTTPIDFVYKVLFPYAKSHVQSYLSTHRSLPGVQDDIAGLIAENVLDTKEGEDPPPIEGSATSASVEAISTYVSWLIDRDRKTTPLKSLQGKIWDEGYRKGDLRSQVYEDVATAFERWWEQGKKIYIYSSGSVLAQKLLFGNTEAGDLTEFINGYFDTNIGAKKEVESYRRIADALNLQPSKVMFVSDVVDELDAAASVGFQTVLCVRPGNPKQRSDSGHPIKMTFDEIQSHSFS
jgi:enolase-phosphatase E1